jgi:hypothetical protein
MTESRFAEFASTVLELRHSEEEYAQAKYEINRVQIV